MKPLRIPKIVREMLDALAENGAEVKRDGYVTTVNLAPGRGEFWGAGDVTPLMLAAGIGNEPEVRRLIAEGADVHAVTAFPKAGLTAMMYASEAGHAKIVEVLLSAGASTARTPGNKDWDYGRPPLNFACDNGHAETVRVLLAAGAAKSRRDLHSALGDALYAGHVEIAKIMREAGAKLRGGSASGDNVLFAAIKGNAVDYVRELLTDGVSPNLKGALNESALEFAVCEGRKEIARLLLEHGANPDGNSDLTPLVWAIAKGNIAMLDVLIAAGADVNACPGESRMTALHFASRDGHFDVVKRLLGAGAKLDLKNSKGRTPFFLACAEWHTEIAELLLQSGADVAIVDKDGWSVSDAAKDRGTRLHAGEADAKRMRKFIKELAIASTRPTEEPEQAADEEPWPGTSRFPSRKGVRELARSISASLNINHKSFRKYKNTYCWPMTETNARTVADEWRSRAKDARADLLTVEGADGNFLLLAPRCESINLLQILDVTPVNAKLSPRLLANRINGIAFRYEAAIRAAGRNWMRIHSETVEKKPASAATLARKLNAQCPMRGENMVAKLQQQLEANAEVLLRWD